MHVDVKYVLRPRYLSDILGLRRSANMSGHSKWATIKRAKAANDNARGKVFSKLVRGITLAAKTGGADPAANYKLRVAIEAARAENMPKETIERAITKGSDTDLLEEIVYEGFGPGGIGVLVYTATDNRNRTAQEVKSVFERAGGNLGSPGSVSFNFEPKGFLLIEKSTDTSTQMLALIDTGVEDIEETDEGIEAYVNSHDLFDAKRKIESLGFKVLAAELIQRPKSRIQTDQKGQDALLALIGELTSHDDVQKVFDNATIN